MKIFAFTFLFLSIAGSVFAQDKIAKDILFSDSVTAAPTARVLVVMRSPDVGVAPSVAFSAPANYLSGVLTNDALSVSAIPALPVAVVELNEEGLAALENDPNVAFVLPDVPMALPPFERVAVASSASVDLSADFAGSGQWVAVLDSGVETTHEVFAGKSVREACFSTAESGAFRLGSLCPNGLDTQIETPGAGGACGIDGCEHGTHVASIAVGNSSRMKGVAPSSNLIAVQVFTRFDDPNVCGASIPCIRSFPSDQLRAMQYIFDLTEEIEISSVNLSLGGGRHLTSCDATSPLNEIVSRFATKGVGVAIAAGNDGFANAVSSPGCVSGAVTVTALDASGEIDVRYANVSGDVDIAALGTEVFGAVLGNDYERLTGTSMATPFVAGMISVLNEVRNTITVAELNRTIDLAGSLVTDPRSGTIVPVADVTASVAFVENLPDPALTSSMVPVDYSFINSSSIVVSGAGFFGEGAIEEAQALVPGSEARIQANGDLVINNPRGFTPNAIEGLRTGLSDNNGVQIFDNPLNNLSLGK